MAADWPDLEAIVERRVKPERLKINDAVGRRLWWRFLRRRDGLYNTIAPLERVLVTSRLSPYLAIAELPAGQVYSEQLVPFAYPNLAPFAVLQSRVHEVWARFFSSSMKDDLRYAPSDCFETFPFPPGYEADPALEAAGRAYYDHRAALMVEADEGMTKTYNRFHRADERRPAIQCLRELHESIDRAVLHAYGWDDLADALRPQFLTAEDEDEHTYQDRLFWAAEARDLVLARLLALNAQRHAEEVAAGLDLN